MIIGHWSIRYIQWSVGISGSHRVSSHWVASSHINASSSITSFTERNSSGCESRRHLQIYNPVQSCGWLFQSGLIEAGRRRPRRRSLAVSPRPSRTWTGHVGLLLLLDLSRCHSHLGNSELHYSLRFHLNYISLWVFPMSQLVVSGMGKFYFIGNCELRLSFFSRQRRSVCCG